MIADRVVLARLAPRVAGWLAVAVGLYAIADLADVLARPLPWSRLPLRLAAMTFQSLPVALAAAVAHTVLALRRSGEWTGLAASGIGTARALLPVAVVAALAAGGSWWIGNDVAPAAARAWRAAGGGPPPGAVVLPMPAAGWVREGRSLVRAGPAPLRVRFDEAGGPPAIETDAVTHGRAAPSLPPSTDVSRAELLRLVRRAPDALPYALEAAFRPLVAAAALLVPLIVLALVGPRPLGPRAAALLTVAVCLGAYAVLATAFSLAAASVAPPATAALGAALVLLAVAGVAAAGSVARPGAA